MTGSSSMYAPIPMCPGPVTLHPDVLTAIARDYGSGDSDPEFLPFYKQTAEKIARLMYTKNDVVIMTGEGMLALWGAMKSCLKAGDSVLAVGTGVFGDGMGEMAASIGCKVTNISLPYNSTIGCDDSLAKIEKAIKETKPVMITAVHCETPSGTMNPLAELGELKQRYNVPLFYVDAVASLGGEFIDADAWNIDLVLCGSQKCLSAPPSMSMLSVSPAAWEIMAKVNYQGYDAVLPFRTIYKDAYFPYTPNWHGVAALNAGAGAILREGMEESFERHKAAREKCREGLVRLGVELFPRDDAVTAATVTAAMVPEKFTWPEWQKALRARGLVVAGSFGPMAGKVFRLGHMGVQADVGLVGRALDAIEDALREKR